MAAIPPMTVTFDDGTEVLVVVKSRDMARAEEDGLDFTSVGPMKAMYAAALACFCWASISCILPMALNIAPTRGLHMVTSPC